MQDATGYHIKEEMCSMLETRKHIQETLFNRYGKEPTRLSSLRLRLKVVIWAWTVGASYLVKRLVDIVGSLVLILALLPVFLLTALAIVLEDYGPVFFCQTRVGINGSHFKMFKFRSMVTHAEAMKHDLEVKNESGDGVIFKMKRDPRVTRVGRIIRKLSIDELPQFLNVLLGQMSLVGPRPPVPKEVDCYSLEERKRLHVRPGITCIWQVSGRSDIPFHQQVQLDLQYIQSQSLGKDIMLLLKTVPAVLLGKGSY